MRTALSEISTVDATFAEDVDAYAAAGFDAIGIWEFKLPADDDANRAQLGGTGLAVASCVPTVPSILPLGIPGLEGPPDPEERIAALCASMQRLAAYDPACVICLTGPAGGREVAEARSLVVDGLRRVAAAARDAGVTLAFEPVHPAQKTIVSFVNSIVEAVDLLDQAGLGDVSLLLDLYHVWDDPAVWDFMGRASYRIAGVHVADWPAATGRADRVLPGEGMSRTRELIAALALTGWEGFLEVEIFSEPDRFWGLPVDEAARQAHAALVGVMPE